MKDIYLKYLNLTQENERLTVPPEIPHDAFKLLEIIASRHYENNPITVSEAMRLGVIASPASIHRKLDILREGGLITSLHKDNDRRTQYLKPLTKAEIIFESRGNCILKILSDNSKDQKQEAALNIGDFHC
jgi:DNA-binding MarR family transcriptional regulator